MATITAPSTTNTRPAEFIGPCGDCACEKYADCAYCGTCTARDPWAEADAAALADARWDREHAGSFGDWLSAR